jgi:hypothetical protein
MADRVKQKSEGILKSIWDGAVEGDFSSNESPTKKATQIAVGFIPIAGQISDARDTIAAVRNVRNGKGDGWTGVGIALAGWVPLAGDFAKSVYKSGLRRTFGGIGEALGSIRERWSNIRLYSPTKQGETSGLFYKPALNTSADDLPLSLTSATNPWGDSRVANYLTEKQVEEALAREAVFRALSPRFVIGQELRADIASLGYTESHLIRRVQDGIAEGWGKFQTRGLEGFKEGWEAPLNDLYDLDPERIQIEKNILLGLGTSGIGAGLTLAEQSNKDE